MNDSVAQKKTKSPKQLTLYSMFFISSTMVPYSVRNYRLRIIVKETMQKSQYSKNKVSLTYYQKNHTLDLFPWTIALNLEVISIAILEKKYYKNLKKAFYEQVGRTNIQNLQQQLLENKKPVQSLIIYGNLNQNKGKMLASLQVSFKQQASSTNKITQVQASEIFTFQLKNKFSQVDLKKNATQQIFKEDEEKNTRKKLQQKPKNIPISQNNLYKIEQQKKTQSGDEVEQLKIQLQQKVGKLKLQISTLIENQENKKKENKDQILIQKKNIQTDKLQVNLPQSKKSQTKKYKVQYTPQFTHLIQASQQDVKSFRKISLQNIQIRTINTKKNILNSEPISIAMTFYDISTDTSIKEQILTIYTQIILDKNNDISYLNESPDQVRLPLDYKSILIQVIFYHNQYLYMSKITRQVAVALKAILVKQESSACRLKLYNKKGVQIGKLSLTIDDEFFKKKSPPKNQSSDFNIIQKRQLNINNSRSKAIAPTNHIRAKSEIHSTNNTSLYNFKINKKSLASINHQKDNKIQNEQQKSLPILISKQNSLYGSRTMNKKKVKTEFSFINKDSTDSLKFIDKGRYPQSLEFEKQQTNQKNFQFQQQDRKPLRKQTITSQCQNMLKHDSHSNEQKNISHSNKFSLKLSNVKVSIYSQYLSKQKTNFQLHLKTDNNLFVQDIPSSKFEFLQFWATYQSDKSHNFQACEQNQNIKIQFYSVTSKNANKTYKKIASREIPLKQILKPKLSYKGYLENGQREPNGQIQFQYQTNKECYQMAQSIQWKSILVRKKPTQKNSFLQRIKTQTVINNADTQKSSSGKMQN